MRINIVAPTIVRLRLERVVFLQQLNSGHLCFAHSSQLLGRAQNAWVQTPSGTIWSNKKIYKFYKYNKYIYVKEKNK